MFASPNPAKLEPKGASRLIELVGGPLVNTNTRKHKHMRHWLCLHVYIVRSTVSTAHEKTGFALFADVS
jgi:hypothetical protein